MSLAFVTSFRDTTASAANSFTFADGHAEMHRWVDSSILAAGLKSASGTAAFNFSGPTSGLDYEYVRDRYRHQGWK